jgi:PhnB protein
MAVLNPYLSFHDNARAAMEFYRDVFGGELAINTFGEYPDMVQNPDQGSLVMHAQLETPAGFTLMASDSPEGMPYSPPAGFSVSVSGTEAEVEPYWEALAADGTVVMPFETPPWGGRFGMLTDKFGIAWMVSANPEG